MKDREIVSVYWHGAASGFGRDRGTLLAGRDQNGITPTLSVFSEPDGRTHARRHAPAPTARHVVTPAIRQPAPAPAMTAAPALLREKQLRRCACGCGLFVLLQRGQDARAAAYVEGHAQTPNPARRRRRIGALAAAARAAQQERSA